MNMWYVYKKDTGLFTGVSLMTTSIDGIKSMLAEDESAWVGPVDCLSQRVDVATNTLVDYQPPAPDEDHDWNLTTKRWELKPDVLSAQQADAAAREALTELDMQSIRAIREAMLGDTSAIDRLTALNQQATEVRADVINVDA